MTMDGNDGVYHALPLDDCDQDLIQDGSEGYHHHFLENMPSGSPKSIQNIQEPARSLLLLDGGSVEAEEQEEEEEDHPPYSPAYELKYFFKVGVPLGGSSVFEWGIPPVFAMIMAGHVNNSVEVQTGLGYARVFYNTTNLMWTIGCAQYFQNVLPGCIGANRKDRIPMYFKRAVLISTMFMCPLYVLQVYSKFSDLTFWFILMLLLLLLLLLLVLL